MKNLILFNSIFLILSCSTPSQKSSNPGFQWMQYKNIEEAGFDSTQLNIVKEVFLKQGGDALLIIRDGIVVLNAGQTSRCFRQTSVRKSYLNAL
jgi:hypothetical protein